MNGKWSCRTPGQVPNWWEGTPFLVCGFPLRIYFKETSKMAFKERQSRLGKVLATSCRWNVRQGLPVPPTPSLNQQTSAQRCHISFPKTPDPVATSVPGRERIETLVGAEHFYGSRTHQAKRELRSHRTISGRNKGSQLILDDKKQRK